MLSLILWMLRISDFIKLMNLNEKKSISNAPAQKESVKKRGIFIVQTIRLSFEKKISIETNTKYKLLHAYFQCVYIVSAKYQIAPSKAVVGVDWPIKGTIHAYTKAI